MSDPSSARPPGLPQLGDFTELIKAQKQRKQIGKKRVLVLDEDEKSSEILQFALSDLFPILQVDIATSLPDATKLLNEISYEALLTEFEFKSGDANQFFDQIRLSGENKNINLLFMCEKKTKEILKKAIDLKAVSFFKKPLVVEDVAKKINEVLNLKP